MNFTSFLKHAERLIVNNSPVILTAIGVAGTLTTAYLTGKATVKAVKHLNNNWEDYGTNLSTQDKFKEVWKFYIPASGTAAFTVASIICANRISGRRAAALAAAYSISERAFDEYKTKVIEKMGEKKEQAVRDEIAQDRVNRHPVSTSEVIIIGNSDVLCYDIYTGRYFTSSVEKIRSAQNTINERLIHDHYASLTDFYDIIGLPATKVSDEVGWNLDFMLKVDTNTTTISDDGRPCLVMDFDVSPSRQFFRCL